jgi:TonB-dependent starch-binding outer membrane protein SusC
MKKMKSKLSLMQATMKSFLGILACFLCITASLSAQNSVSGKIVDSQSEPLVGASILVKGTSNGTLTDTEGSFMLKDVPKGSTLVVSFVGYGSQEIISDGSAINVTLIEGSALNELVVVGYGTQERRDVTGAVSSIKGENIRDLPVTSLDQKIAGQVAGVQVSQVTGTPGSAPVIRIRGAGSIGAGDDPLYVIDGFPMTNYYSKFSNPLSTISPDDIENITILKDASSTAIYGSRGSNGVILITTKKAKKGVSSIEFSTYTGVQSIPDNNRVQMMTSQEYAQNRILGAQQLAAIKNVPFDLNTVAAEYRNPSALTNSTDWFKEISRPNAPMQNYNLSISKGGENLRSVISLGYFNQQGVLKNTDFQRFSLRANMDANLSKNVTVGMNISPSYSIRNIGETDGHFNTAIVTQSYLNSPIPTVYQADGSFTPNITSAGLFNNANTVNMLVNTKNKTDNIRALANTYLAWELLPNLKFLTTFNADFIVDLNDRFVPTTVGGFRNPPPTLATGNNYSARTYNWLSENTLTYSKDMNDHRITALAGYSAQKEVFSSTQVNGSGYADDYIKTINAAVATGVTASAGSGKGSLLSYFGRLTYGFKGKYLVNASVRRDGSSKFGKDNRWGTFPSASIGWRLSEEAFFPKTDIIDNVKLRLSYGLSGNNNIGNFTSQQLLGYDNYVFNNKIVPGQAINSLGNTNLGWEQSKQTDIGFDADLFKGRVNLILEYYQRFTQSMLQSIDIPASSGFLTTVTNIGNVRNKGVEITLASHNITKGQFRWETDFNIAFNRNKVINLGNKTRISSGDNGSITEVDRPMGVFFGYKKAGGFFTSADDLAKFPRAPVQTIGSIRFVDVNNDGKIDANDQTVIGSPYADFIFGMTNRFTFGGLDVSILLNGSQGNQILDFYKRFTYNQDGVFNLHKDVLDNYKDAANQGSGNVQSTGSALNGDSFSRNTSDAWVEDASYVSVRNVTIGYMIKPSKYIKGVRLYFSGQNLMTFTQYKGSFPEVGIAGSNSLAQGVNYGAYPLAKTLTFGANVKF